MWVLHFYNLHNEQSRAATFRAVPKSQSDLRADRSIAGHASAKHLSAAIGRRDEPAASTAAGQRALNLAKRGPSAREAGQHERRTCGECGKQLDFAAAGDVAQRAECNSGLMQRFYKKAAAFVLRAVAKHSTQLAKAVVDSGALEALVVCLEEFDPTVKEAAAWALSCIAKHTPELAMSVVEAGAVPLLVLCVQEPEPTLKRIAATALS